MSTSKPVQITLFGIVLLLMLGIFAVNWEAGLYTLLGLIVALPVFLLLQFLSERFGHRVLIALASIMTILSVVVLVFLFGGSFLLSNFGQAAADISLPAIKEYRANFIYDGNSRSFFVQESIVAHDGEFVEFPKEEVHPEWNGLIVRQVSVNPLRVDSLGEVVLVLPSGNQISGDLCGGTCPESQIQILDFPRDAFYEAFAAVDSKKEPFKDTESLYWTTRRLDSGVSFLYIVPPFNRIRPILEPVLYATTSVSNFLIGIGVFVFTMIGGIITGTFTDIGKTWLKEWLRKSDEPSRRK